MKTNTFLISIVFLVLITSLINAQDTFSTYPMEKVKTFGIGQKDGFIGVNMDSPEARGPFAIGFTPDSRLMILDYLNNRIQVFGSNFQVVQTIPIDYSFIPLNLNMNEYGVWGSSDSLVIGFDFNGNKILHYENRNKRFSAFLYNKILFLHFDDGSLQAIVEPVPDRQANDGKLLSENQTQALFSTPEKYGLKELAIDSAKRLFLRNVIQTGNYKTFFEYWMEKNGKKDMKSFWSSKDHKYQPVSGLSEGMRCMGVDVKGNYYWVSNFGYVFIFNNIGIIIDKLKFSDPANTTIVTTVHPSGDIYFLDYDDNGVYLYRIKNIWDPKGREAWYKAHL
jgi:hypothetical protein